MQAKSEYFLEAMDAVRASKAKYAEAEAHASAVRPIRPSYFYPYTTCDPEEMEE